MFTRLFLSETLHRGKPYLHCDWKSYCTHCVYHVYAFLPICFLIHLLWLNWPLHETRVFVLYLHLSPITVHFVCVVCGCNDFTSLSLQLKPNVWFAGKHKIAWTCFGVKVDSLFLPGISIHLPMSQVSRPHWNLNWKNFMYNTNICSISEWTWGFYLQRQRSSLY